MLIIQERKQWSNSLLYDVLANKLYKNNIVKSEMNIHF